MSRRRSKIARSGARQSEVGPRAFLEPLARILNVSGCHPRELQREFARICRDLPQPKRAWEPMRPGYLADLAHVIARWHSDEQYIDADGRPVPLPLEGPEPSLKGLIARVLPGVDPALAIQWLTELQGIRRQGKHFRPTDKYLAFNRSPVAAWAHGLVAVLGMLRTVEHNVSAPPPRRLLERMAINPRFPIRALPQFHRELKRQAGEIVWRFDADMRRKEARLKGEPVTRLCIGLYAFEDPPVTGSRRRAHRGERRTQPSKRRSPWRSR
jgi:hypothetical protein